MKRFILLVGGFIGLLCVVLVALTFVDINRYKPTIEAAVFDATGRELQLRGPIHVGLSMTPTIVADDVQFGNADWGSRPVMLEAAELEIGLSIINLFTADVEVSRVAARDVSLFVETRADGRSNLELRKPGEPEHGDAVAGGAITLPSIDIRNVGIVYHAGRTGQTVSAQFERIAAESSLLGIQGEIEGEFEGQRVVVSGRFAGSADDFQIDDLSVEFGRAKFTGEATAKRPKPGAPFDVTAAIAANQADLTPYIADMLAEKEEREVASGEAPLDFSFLALANGTATLSIDRLRYHDLVIDDVLLEGRSQGLSGAVDVSASYRKKGVRLAAKIDAANTPSGTLTVDVDELNLGEMLAEARITNDVVATVKGHVALSTRGASARALTESLGGEVKGSILLDRIDLTDIVERPGSDQEVEEEGVFPEERMPTELVAGLKGEIIVEAGEILYQDMSLTKLSLPISFGGQKVDLLATGTFREREIHASMMADFNSHPAYEFDLRADDFDFGGLLADLGMTDLVKIRTDLAFHGKTRGDTLKAMASGFTGALNMVAGEGEVATSAFELIATDLVWALVPKGGRDRGAKITCIVNRVDFVEGVGTVSAFALVTKRMRTGGGGTINLGTEALDLILYPKPNDISLLSLSTPIRIRGPIRDPNIFPDTGSLLVGAAEAFGVGALTGGVGALLPLMNLRNFDAEDADACVKMLKEGAPATGGSGVGDLIEGGAGVVGEGVGTVGEGVGAVGEGIGSVLEGVGDLFGGDKE